MAKHRRSRTDIIADILGIAAEGALKTRIMYGANLSYTQLKKYLPLLLKEKLLQTRKGDDWMIYTTTEKGRKFLQEIKQGKETNEDTFALLLRVERKASKFSENEKYKGIHS